MDGSYCGLAIFLLAVLIFAAEFTLDAIIRNLRRHYHKIWIEEGQPVASIRLPDWHSFGGGWARHRLRWRLLTKTPNWAKTHDKLRSLVFQLRVLCIVLIAYIAVVLILDALI